MSETEALTALGDALSELNDCGWSTHALMCRVEDLLGVKPAVPEGRSVPESGTEHADELDVIEAVMEDLDGLYASGAGSVVVYQNARVAVRAITAQWDIVSSLVEAEIVDDGPDELEQQINDARVALERLLWTRAPDIVYPLGNLVAEVAKRIDRLRTLVPHVKDPSDRAALLRALEHS